MLSFFFEITSNFKKPDLSAYTEQPKNAFPITQQFRHSQTTAAMAQRVLALIRTVVDFDTVHGILVLQTCRIQGLQGPGGIKTRFQQPGKV